MLFDKPETISLLSCQTCKATGYIGFSKCKECRGMSAGHFDRGNWLFWFYPLTRYHLSLAKARRIFNKVRFFSSIILWLTAWGWGIYFISRNLTINFSLILDPAYWLYLLSTIHGIGAVLFYAGAWILLYLWYRAIVERIKKANVERYHYGEYGAIKEPEEKLEISQWNQTKKIKSKKKINIADTFTDEALSVLGEA